MDSTASKETHLHFQKYGEGAPLLILHGLFGSLANWRSLSERLSETYQVFAVDLRNHGRSAHSDTFNYRVMAEDINTLMQQQQLASAHLLGHSMGGKTAMQFALNHPDKTSKLIIADMAPKVYQPRHNEIFDALRALDMSTFNSRRELTEKLNEKIPNVAVQQFFLMNAAANETAGLKWRFNLEAIYNNYHQISRNIETNSTFDKPTLFIRGSTSDYIQDEDTDTIKAIFPQARIATIEGAGHWVHADAPEEFLRLVSEFLSE